MAGRALSLIASPREVTLAGDRRRDSASAREIDWLGLLVGPALALVAFGLYWWVGPVQAGTDAYIPLANAMLHGSVSLDPAYYTWIELALYHGGWFVPYPPVPAIVLLPFVAIFGQTFDTNLTAAIAGAIGVWLMWGLLRQLGLSLRTAFALTAAWAVGSEVFWASAVGGTHLFAETLAATLLLATLRLALARRAPVLAGVLLGAAIGSRLPLVFALPLVVGLYVGLPTRIRRPSAGQLYDVVELGLGLAGPALAIALYNFARFRSPIEFGYGLITSRDGHSVLEEADYKDGIVSLAYLPRGLWAMLAKPWDIVGAFPWLHPTWAGQAVTFTTPLLAWLARARFRDPLVVYALMSAALILLVDLIHGGTGYAQFGYRFIVDALPILWLVLGTVFRDGIGRWAAVAAVLSVVAFTYGMIAIWGFNFVGS
jgi:hypothetical protein